MKTSSRSPLIALVFLAGCAVGGASSQLVVSQATAKSTVQRWDYMCFTPGTNKITDKAKEAGRHGWEMVAAGSNLRASAVWCFKRPL